MVSQSEWITYCCYDYDVVLYSFFSLLPVRRHTAEIEAKKHVKHKIHFSHFASTFALPPLYMRAKWDWGDIKICYSFISIHLIHKNHMFNITVPAFVSVSFRLRLALSLLKSRSTQENLYLLFILSRQKTHEETLKILTCSRVSVKLFSFPSRARWLLPCAV